MEATEENHIFVGEKQKVSRHSMPMEYICLYHLSRTVAQKKAYMKEAFLKIIFAAAIPLQYFQ